MGDLPDERPKQLTPPSFAREVKLIILHKGGIGIVKRFVYLNHKHTKVLGMDICFIVLC